MIAGHLARNMRPTRYIPQPPERHSSFFKKNPATRFTELQLPVARLSISNEIWTWGEGRPVFAAAGGGTDSRVGGRTGLRAIFRRMAMASRAAAATGGSAL